MEYPRDWVITTDGRAVRRDRANEKDKFEDVLSVDGEEGGETIKNSFLEKDEALLARDNIIEQWPAAFLQIKETKEEITMPRKKITTQDEFREMVREECVKRMPEYWQNWAKLTPSGKCDYFYKMLIFGFSKAPNVKSVTPAEDEAYRNANKRARAAAAIDQGIQIEDTDFEE